MEPAVAAARIKVSRFNDDLPPVTKGSYIGGRQVKTGPEEAANWRLFVNPPQNINNYAGRTLLALDRWARLIRYYGANATGMGISYTSFYSGVLSTRGCTISDYDECRMATLICEKYGIHFYPDLFRAY